MATIDKPLSPPSLAKVKRKVNALLKSHSPSDIPLLCDLLKAYSSPRRKELTPQCIAIDLTFLPAEDQYGDRARAALELIQQFGLIKPTLNLILLTTNQTHDHLKYLEKGSITRFNLDLNHPECPELKYSTLRAVKADLLFCPFTKSTFHEPHTPTVLVVYGTPLMENAHVLGPGISDLDSRTIDRALQVASKIICASDSTKNSLLESGQISVERLTTIQTQRPHSLQRVSAQEVESTLQHYKLTKEEFLFFPGNYQPLDNYKMLFLAFQAFRRKHPTTMLKLACTGASNSYFLHLKDCVERMGLEQDVRLTSDIEDYSLAALYQSCSAVIYPSLLKWPGTTLVRALAFQSPIICGRFQETLDIVTEDAIYFDPRKPSEIVLAIEHLFKESRRTPSLTERAASRFERFQDPKAAAGMYLDAMNEAFANPYLGSWKELILHWSSRLKLAGHFSKNSHSPMPQSGGT